MRTPRARMVAVAIALAALFSPPPASAGKAGAVRLESMENLNAGVSAYKRGEYALAVERLQAAAAAALSSFRTHYYLGLALTGDRRYTEALAALEIALDLDPGHLPSLVAQGDVMLKMGDLEEARASYYRALKIRPAYAASLDGLARVYEAQDKDKEAIAQYRQAIQSNSGFAPAYTHLGDLYLRQGRFEEAVQLLEEAITVRPDYAPGLNRLALAYGRLGLDNEAVATIQKAIELEPNNAAHSATLGELQLGLGFIVEAERSFEKALRQDVALPEARLGLAEVWRRRGDYDFAREQLAISLEDPRSDARTIKRLETFYARIDEEELDFCRLEISVSTGEALSEEYVQLSALYVGRGAWDTAAILENQGADPSIEAQERLAYLHFRSGKFGDAHRMYGALAGETSEAHHELNDGVALALLGDDSAAAAAYRRALEAAPGNLQARLYLGNSLLRLGDEAAAVAEYVEYLDHSQDGENSERVRRILRQIAPDALPQPPPEETAAGKS